VERTIDLNWKGSTRSTQTQPRADNKLEAKSIRIATVLLMVVAPLAVQWVNYRAAGTPVTRDDKPNLSAMHEVLSLCAGHAQRFRGESPLPNLMEVKG
jgi:hypothetical protein